MLQPPDGSVTWNRPAVSVATDCWVASPCLLTNTNFAPPTGNTELFATTCPFTLDPLTGRLTTWSNRVGAGVRGSAGGIAVFGNGCLSDPGLNVPLAGGFSSTPIGTLVRGISAPPAGGFSATPLGPPPGPHGFGHGGGGAQLVTASM